MPNAPYHPGEIMETHWVGLNQLAKTTSQMNKDNRHILMTAFMSRWNTSRIEQMRKYLGSVKVRNSLQL